jgi:hypothetical protein
LHHADAGAWKQRVNKARNEQRHRHVSTSNSNAIVPAATLSVIKILGRTESNLQAETEIFAICFRNFGGISDWLKVSSLRKRQQMNGVPVLAKKNQLL